MKRTNTSADCVFEQLGFEKSQAANLRVRAAMMDAVIAEIEKRGLPQARAAKLMGITQPRVSDLMRGKLHLFSIDTLVTLLSGLGMRVEFKVKKAA